VKESIQNQSKLKLDSCAIPSSNDVTFSGDHCRHTGQLGISHEQAVVGKVFETDGTLAESASTLI
jgi:hypothetical protein